MKDWTIMVYMAGDNNLSENMASSLEGLGMFASNTPAGEKCPVNLLAYFDSSSLTAPTFYIDYSDANRETAATHHAITNRDMFHSKTRDAKKMRGTNPDAAVEQDSASAYTILNFVRWCIKTQGRSAKNYALIFSGHSFGFHGTSFLRDESSGSYMTLFMFRKALERANKLYFQNEFSNRVAILGFDSCVMSMLEVGYELKGVAQTLVASEGSLPNAGWSYAPLLTDFVSTHSKSQKSKTEVTGSDNESAGRAPQHIREAASAIVRRFTEQQKTLLIGGRSVDISAWDLAMVPALAANINALAVELNKHLDLTQKYRSKKVTDADIRLLHELKKILLQSHYDSQTYMEEQCVDLKDFCLRLIFECNFFDGDKNAEVFGEIRRLCNKIILSVDECVLKCGYSGEEYQFSNGISLYFPWSYLTYSLTNYKYRYLLFTRGERNYHLDSPKGIGKDWNTFLENYVSRVTLRQARKDANGKLLKIGMLNKNNPPGSKSNPPWSKSNPPWSKSNPPWSKSNPPWSKDNPPWNRGEVGDYLFYFSRFKNFELRWDIAGYADDM